MPRHTAPIHFQGLGAFTGYWQKVIGALVIAAVVAGPRAVDAQAPTANLEPGSQCVSNFDANIDYFPIKSTVEKATGFTLQYFKNYKVLKNTNTNETFALYQCGTPAPSNLTNGTKVFSIPVNHVATLETSDNAYITFLGQIGSIKALEYSQAVSNPCLQALQANNSVAGVDSTNATATTSVLSQAQVQFGAFSADATQNTSVSTAAVSEDTFGRIEWIKFYGAFYNLEDKANNLYSTATATYNCSAAKATSSQKNNLTVAWVSYLPPSSYNNNTASWGYVPASYKKSLTIAAGGTYYVNTSFKQWNTSDSFLETLTNVDLLIDETYIATDLNAVFKNFGINDTNKANFKFVQNKRIYREDGIQSQAGGFDWFESAIPSQDAVLQDLIAAFSADTNGISNLPTSKYQRMWLRNVVLNESVKYDAAANCSANSLIDPAQSCSAVNSSSSGSGTGSGSSSGAASLDSINGWTGLLTIFATFIAVLAV